MTIYDVHGIEEQQVPLQMIKKKENSEKNEITFSALIFL
jgi:hypothetical protein